MVFWTISLGYALAAAVPVVLIEAAANSSGIPEVKMILNGVKMPRITRFKTLLCRIWGNIFSVSSGLPGTCRFLPRMLGLPPQHIIAPACAPHTRPA